MVRPFRRGWFNPVGLAVGPALVASTGLDDMRQHVTHLLAQKVV